MLSFFPLDVLDEIWDLIESVSEAFLTYSSMARTLMARLLCLTSTRSLIPMVPYMKLLWSDFFLHLWFHAVIFIFYFSNRRALNIDNENNNTKTLTRL